MRNTPIVLSEHTNLYQFRELLKKGEHKLFYRIENKNIKGPIESHELKGKWFSDDLNYVLNYLRKNQAKTGARMSVIAIPNNQIEKFHISQIVGNEDLDVEQNNYIFDRENLPGDSHILDISLDEIEQVGGNFFKAQQVKEDLKEDIFRILK